MRDRLLSWFDEHARPLPWRRGRRRSAYEVLVAETLLQQTQAARAALALPAFLARFPDLPTLAAADEGAVLAAWQGLGYYQRALRLQRCARALERDHGGRLPADPDTLAALPGVGRYTARAIAAQAFGRPCVAVDANVRRVGARVLALARPDDRRIEAGLTDVLLREVEPDDTRASGVAEALIELGATLCRPRRPSCHACPLHAACEASQRGAAESFPAPRPARARRHEALALLVALRHGAVALRRRPTHGRWAGLWGFPHVDECSTEGRPLPAFEHVLTHRTLEVRPLLVASERAPQGTRWVPLAQVAEGGGDHPVAAVDQRLARRLLSDGRHCRSDGTSTVRHHVAARTLAERETGREV